MKDQDKKVHPTKDPWYLKFGIGQMKYPTRIIYILCLGTLICAMVLWGMSVQQERVGRAAEAQIKLSPEEVKKHLAEIDAQVKHILNSSKPFTKFGPPVRNWDAHRKAAKAKIFNGTRKDGKPRVLIITSSHPKKCDNRQGDQMLLKSIKNKMDYARLHGFDIFYNMDKIDSEMTGWWVKVFLTHMLMKDHPEYDWIWWMDSDAIFTDMTFEVPWEKYGNYNMIMHGWEDAVYEKRSWLGLNAGVYLLRNCQWSMDLLHAWAPMSPQGPVRDGMSPLFGKAMPERGEGEADDQSALVYLMITQRAKWGDKVYLESSYYFQGYWRVITERFEEMMEKYKPGLYGDDRWPFVTHFCGCEFCCGKINPEYTVDGCIHHMERAVNFADNQIIGRYGFHHKSLETVDVEPRNDTLPAKTSKTDAH